MTSGGRHFRDQCTIHKSTFQLRSDSHYLIHTLSRKERRMEAKVAEVVELERNELGISWRA